MFLGKALNHKLLLLRYPGKASQNEEHECSFTTCDVARPICPVMVQCTKLWLLNHQSVGSNPGHDTQHSMFLGKAQKCMCAAIYVKTRKVAHKHSRSVYADSLNVGVQKINPTTDMDSRQVTLKSFSHLHMLFYLYFCYFSVTAHNWLRAIECYSWY